LRTGAQLAHISHVLNHVSEYTDFNATLKMQKGFIKRAELKRLSQDCHFSVKGDGGAIY
jgi:hypothetical protein